MFVSSWIKYRLKRCYFLFQASNFFSSRQAHCFASKCKRLYYYWSFWFGVVSYNDYSFNIIWRSDILFFHFLLKQQINSYKMYKSSLFNRLKVFFDELWFRQLLCFLNVGKSHVFISFLNLHFTICIIFCKSVDVNYII